jgi:pyrrolidone-carboxylate peptidase
MFITGFGPFGTVDKNPSATLARSLAATYGCPFQILKVTYGAVDEFLASGEAFGTRALLMLGYADRDALTPELIGRNLSGPTPDVSGLSRPGVILPGRPEKLLSTLWTSQTSLPTGMRFSDDAGGYLCNYLLYRSLALEKWAKVGFLHVPGFEVIPQKEQLFAIRKLLATCI